MSENFFKLLSEVRNMEYMKNSFLFFADFNSIGVIFSLYSIYATWVHIFLFLFQAHLEWV